MTARRWFDVVFTVRMKARTEEAARERADRIAQEIQERVSVESVEVEVEEDEPDGRAA